MEILFYCLIAAHSIVNISITIRLLMEYIAEPPAFDPPWYETALFLCATLLFGWMIFVAAYYFNNHKIQ